MAIGGFQNGIGKIPDAELVDLSTNSGGVQGCALAPYPVATNDFYGVFVNGAVRTCGGATNDGGAVDSCYEYDAAGNEWNQVDPMLDRRYWFGSSLIGEDTWLITGGTDGGLKSSVEIWNPRDGSRYSTDMPEGRSNHCQVTLDEKYVFVFGGTDSTTVTSNEAYLFDIVEERWLLLDDNPFGFLSYLSCGTYMEEGLGSIQVLITGSEGNTVVRRLTTSRKTIKRW